MRDSSLPTVPDDSATPQIMKPAMRKTAHKHAKKRIEIFKTHHTSMCLTILLTRLACNLTRLLFSNTDTFLVVR